MSRFPPPFRRARPRVSTSAFTIGDFYFSGLLSSTYPNRIYLHSGATDRLDDSLKTSSLPTIWDRLSDANIGCNYFYHDVPFTALWGSKYLPISGVTKTKR